MKNERCSIKRRLGILICVLFCGQIANAEFIFGEPELVPSINTSSADAVFSISSDGLELYLSSSHPHGGDHCFSDIWVARRPSVNDPWETPTRLDSPVNTDGPETSPCISADGLELYFDDGHKQFMASGCSHRPGSKNGDLWVSTRPSKDAPWTEPVNLGPNVNSNVIENGPSLSSDGLSLYFTQQLYGGFAKVCVSQGAT